jgi:hypothetical protein
VRRAWNDSFTEKIMNKRTLVVLAAVGAVVVALGLALKVNAGGCCGGGQDIAQPATAPTSAPATVVNTKCPIMGSAIDPTKVPPSLTREYKGQKVGFCCAACPPAWDKLSDADKDAKLAKVVPTAR